MSETSIVVTVADEIQKSEDPLNKKVEDLSTILRGMELLLRGRKEWTWRLGPETYIDLKLSGPLGAREVEAFLGYAVVLAKTLPADSASDVFANAVATVARCKYGHPVKPDSQSGTPGKSGADTRT